MMRWDVAASSIKTQADSTGIIIDYLLKILAYFILRDLSDAITSFIPNGGKQQKWKEIYIFVQEM